MESHDYKKVYGDTGESLIKAVIERTLKKYPKKDIHNLLQNGKEIKAHQIIAKAFGKFAAEIDHVAYCPYKEALPEHSVHWRFYNDVGKYSLYCHVDRFDEAYGIEIKDAKKIWDLLLSGKKDGVTTYENPQLIDCFSFLIDAKECPLPRQTLARILGIQPPPLLIKTKPQLAIKDAAAQKEADEALKIKKEIDANNTTEVNTNSTQDKNCASNTNNAADLTGA